MDNMKTNLIIGSVCVAILIAILITYLNYENNQQEVEELATANSSQEENIDEQYESASTEMGKTVEESENEIAENEENTNNTNQNSVSDENTLNTNNSSERSNTNSSTANSSSSNTTNETSNNETDSENDDEDDEVPDFATPISGEIIREFASDSLVYSNTLDEWITHNGIDIKADKTSVVSSAADGTVYAIKNDPRYGLTVIINHSGGYQTVYSNLLTAEFVVEGETVEQGQTIGTVGNTASFEISDDYHLHFEILKDDEYIDPIICIEFN